MLNIYFKAIIDEGSFYQNLHRKFFQRVIVEQKFVIWSFQR